MFTVVLGMLCNSNFGSTCGPSGVPWGVLAPRFLLSELAYNRTLLLLEPRGRFCAPVTEHPGSWSRVCTGPTDNITHWSYHHFSIINLDLLIYGCMCIESYARTYT